MAWVPSVRTQAYLVAVGRLNYLDFVRDPGNGFVTATIPLGDGIEYSVKL